MRKYRFLAAIFAIFALSACTDLGPTAPQDCESEECGLEGGYIGSGS